MRAPQGNCTLVIMSANIPTLSENILQLPFNGFKKLFGILKLLQPDTQWFPEEVRSILYHSYSIIQTHHQIRIYLKEIIFLNSCPVFGELTRKTDEGPWHDHLVISFFCLSNKKHPICVNTAYLDRGLMFFIFWKLSMNVNQTYAKAEGWHAVFHDGNSWRQREKENKIATHETADIGCHIAYIAYRCALPVVKPVVYTQQYYKQIYKMSTMDSSFSHWQLNMFFCLCASAMGRDGLGQLPWGHETCMDSLH